MFDGKKFQFFVEIFCLHSVMFIRFNYVSRQVIVYYVPKQLSRSLYEDTEFNVRDEGKDGKTASEYKQFDCLGTYDT